MTQDFKITQFILWLNEITKKDIALVGGKNGSLGEMYSCLRKKAYSGQSPDGPSRTKFENRAVNVPNGFALTANSYWHFLKFNQIDGKLKEIFNAFHPQSIESLKETGKKARNLILQSDFPIDLEQEILDAYKKLSVQYGQKYTDVAVRSSATVEDLKGASFAGAMETFLNIKGEKNLLFAVKNCMASWFTNRAIAYREAKGFSHLKNALSVGVLKMVRSDMGSSGVMFTLDTETGFPNVVLINSIYGIGEMIVKGRITPDEFFVFKPTLREGFKPIIVKNLGRKNYKYVYAKTGGLKSARVPLKKQRVFSIDDTDVLKLARWAMIIEEHYGEPQDIEWAKDGKTGELFIVQSRPETVQSIRNRSVYEEYQLNTNKKPVVEGIAVGEKIGVGKVRVIQNISKISQFQPGEILVAKMTDPDWASILPLAAGIITDEGGRTCFGGNTIVLTNIGFLTISRIYEFMQNNRMAHRLKVLSFDVQQNKFIWRFAVKVYKRQASTNQFAVSSNFRTLHNFFEATPDHEFLTFQDRKVVKKTVASIAEKKEGILVPNNICGFKEKIFDIKESYLKGVFLSDGSIYKNKRGGYSVSFTQKIKRSKKAFIETVKAYFKEVYGEELKLVLDRKRETANFVCYKKNVYEAIKSQRESLLLDIFSSDRENLLAFLGGIIDGDGNVSDHQIQITVGKANVLEAIATVSLRLALSPNICKRKNWWVVSFDRKFSLEILKYSKRLKAHYKKSPWEFSKKFIASQVVGDLMEIINKRGKVAHDYFKRGNMITDYKIKSFVFPQVDLKIKKELEKVLNSPFSMQRIRLVNEQKKSQDVYNLTVSAKNELDHNYVIFSSNYTPIVVGNCHAAIVSRELGVPCIVGAKKATKVLKTGQMVTVDCSFGLKGRVFLGKMPFEKKEYNLKSSPQLPVYPVKSAEGGAEQFNRVKIMVNIGSPDTAFKACSLPQDGVGLAREEFIIAEKIKVHPMALHHYQHLKSPALAKAIAAKQNSAISKEEISKIYKKIKEITIEHKDKKEYFIKELAEGIGQIASAFWPKPVIVRFSDFKTNEYAQLIGGELFEPKEENPMLGWRGASRYYDEKFKPAFLMECEAIKRARNVFGLKNIKLMIPFCRTIEEGKKVLAILKEKGFLSGKDDLEIYVMCEIPSNVILAEQFLEIFDGMSIGSNDLTQLVLGLDRDNGQLSRIGDEQNEAVKEMIKKVISVCREKNKYCGICGDAPSSFPDFAQFLVNSGIESISLSPDAVIKTILQLSRSDT